MELADQTIQSHQHQNVSPSLSVLFFHFPLARPTFIRSLLPAHLLCLLPAAADPPLQIPNLCVFFFYGRESLTSSGKPDVTRSALRFLRVLSIF